MISRGMIALLVSMALLTPPGVAAALEGDRFEDGSQMPYHYVAQFWRQHPPGTALSDDSLPGHIVLGAKPFVHDKKIAPSEVALIERKLNMARDALLGTPPLKDIRDHHLTSSINIVRTPSGQVQASLTIGAYVINKADPRTQAVNGRYFTPGSFAVTLRVGFNEPLPGRTWEPARLRGRYNGAYLQQDRSIGFYVPSSDRPLTLGEADELGGEKRNPDFFDLTKRPSELQLLTAQPDFATLRFHRQKVNPVSREGRLVAALMMVDWEDIARRMRELK